MESILKIAEDIKENEENLRKQAKKIVSKKNLEVYRRQTHLFMHEKNLTEIVSDYYHRSKAIILIFKLKYLIFSSSFHF